MEEIIVGEDTGSDDSLFCKENWWNNTKNHTVAVFIVCVDRNIAVIVIFLALKPFRYKMQNEFL